MVHDESAFDIRNAPNIQVPQGYGRHFRSFDGKQRDLVVEAAGGPSWYTEYNVFAGLVGAQLRQVLLFRDPDRGRAGRARPAEFAAPLRLSHLLALSRARRIHGDADVPGIDRRAEFLRQGRDARARGRAGQLLLRHRHQDVRARAHQGPDVLLHLSVGQPFPVGLPLAPRADAGLAGSGQPPGGRRISAAADARHAGVSAVPGAPAAAIPRRALHAGALRRSPAGFRDHRSSSPRSRTMRSSSA